MVDGYLRARSTDTKLLRLKFGRSRMLCVSFVFLATLNYFLVKEYRQSFHVFCALAILFFLLSVAFWFSEKPVEIEIPH